MAAGDFSDLHQHLSELNRALGRLESKVDANTETIERLQEASTTEHRKVHDIVVASSEATRNLTKDVAWMKPIVEGYLESKAEARGIRKFLTPMLILGSSAFTIAAGKLADAFMGKTPSGP